MPARLKRCQSDKHTGLLGEIFGFAASILGTQVADSGNTFLPEKALLSHENPVQTELFSAYG